MGKLITSSILDAASWAMDAPDSIITLDKGGDGRTTWRERAAADLERSLRRIYSDEMPPAVRRGLDFEAEVYRFAVLPEDRLSGGSDLFRDVVSRCRGGRFQFKTKRDIRVDGVVYTVFGKLDVRHPQKIMDLKTTTLYRGPGSYLSKTQHILYPWSSGIPEFEYLVCVFSESDEDKLEEVHRVPYRMEDAGEAEAEITRRIRSFREYLKSQGLDDFYLNDFCLF